MQQNFLGETEIFCINELSSAIKSNHKTYFQTSLIDRALSKEGDKGVNQKTNPSKENRSLSISNKPLLLTLFFKNSGQLYPLKIKLRLL